MAAGPGEAAMARAPLAAARHVQDGLRKAVLPRDGLRGSRCARLGLGAKQGNIFLGHGALGVAQGRGLGAAVPAPRPRRARYGWSLLRHLPAQALPLRLRRPRHGFSGGATGCPLRLHESYPHECRDKGFHVRRPGSLAYLGDGKFCITWTIAIEYSGEDMVPSRFALFLIAVQVIKCPRPAGSSGAGKLRLVKHKVRCYKMSSRALDGYVLQPSLG